MYSFVSDVPGEEHDLFVKNHPLSNLLQSSKWADVKNNWAHAIVGVRKNGMLAASALVLIKKMPAGFCAMYIPRGPILDYTDKELVIYFFKELRKIKYTGALYRGFSKKMHESAQPRFQMGVYQCPDFEQAISKDVRKSRNTALKKHVAVARYGTDQLKAFADLMQMTEERKGIRLRDIGYFRRLMETYGNDTYLFLTSVDPQLRGAEIKTRLLSIEEALKYNHLPHGKEAQLKRERKDLCGELDAMNTVLEKYNGPTFIAGALMIGYGHNAEMLYAGMNKDFRSFKPQYLSHFQRFLYLFDAGYAYVNMGGVEGTLDDGLTQYKSKYNATVREYIGEFDLPIHQSLYKTYCYLKKSRF